MTKHVQCMGHWECLQPAYNLPKSSKQPILSRILSTKCVLEIWKRWPWRAILEWRVGNCRRSWRCSMVTQGVHPIRPYHTLPKEEGWSLCSPQASVILPLRLFSLQLKSLSILPLAKNPGCPLSPFQSITHTSSKFLREDQIFSRINSVCRLWNLW